MTKDNIEGYFVRDDRGNLCTEPDSNRQRWREYVEKLLNEERPHVNCGMAPRNDVAVPQITPAEVEHQLSKMDNNKAVGRDDLPSEALRAAKKTDEIANVFYSILASAKIPERWREGTLVPIYKKKGDYRECSNYRGINLLCHGLKLLERIICGRLRQITTIDRNQFGFMPSVSTTEPTFTLRMRLENALMEQKDFRAVSVDLEKACDTVPREYIPYILRKRSVPETYIQLIQDMYSDSKIAVRSKHGDTDRFNVSVGLYQGSALSPYLFILLLDEISKSIRGNGENDTLELLFADDLVISGDTKEKVQARLEKWREALESHGLRLSRTKTVYLSTKESERIHLQGTEIPNVDMLFNTSVLSWMTKPHQGGT